ncbi:N-fatty-acyl-amino acid synthase/hydrolase PM20D1-like isoform X1 [Bufo gargarizans]|uniref:N-fatty-acyl-amino acid synthase/hydrolase PM20D1-like isoform X1 n=2 Tax=Bufo gargarizans TaxID=30331 RepID=UPI001CF2EA8F|nr:N-fatty-acyl-amino acid synthase/hydrolase PM20D1-like isoform X1 [Bufo gargarizans]
MSRARWRGVGGTLLGLLLFGVGILVAALLVRTYTLPSSQVSWQGPGVAEVTFAPDERQLLKRALIGALRIPTVSFSVTEQNVTALAELGAYIRRVFPRVFSSSIIKHEVVAEYSHLFAVQGSDQSLKPYMILAHLDVVPAPPEGWDVPPFSGEERDGYIYGRGALDNKCCVIGALQALDLLLKRGYKPKRSFYIGLGHDEEVSGHEGAMKVVEKLQSRGVKLLFVIDEGLAVVEGVLQGVKNPVALIGITEKGSITLNLTVNQPPGHSSMPPAETSIGILAAAVSRLEKNPMPNMFGDGPEALMFEHLAGEFAFPLNVMMANLWLFSPIISRVLEQKPSSSAIVRTTTAITIFNAGVKENVIPHTARATVNFRLHPAQTVDEVLDIVRNTINDERVDISVLNSFNPLPNSPHDESNFGYQTLQKTIHSVFSAAPVAPGICIGNTDSRHFVNLTDSIYRFSPFKLKAEDLSRIHGLNERISVEGLEQLTQFYYQLIQNADFDKVPVAHRATHEL